MFDIHQAIFNEAEEIDEDLVGAYIEGMIEEFAGSPEAKPLVEDGPGLSYTAMMMQYAFTYEGVPLPKMTLGDFETVVFEIFPRKVSTPPESAPEIVAELRAFWRFLHRQYALPQAKQILERLEGSVEELRTELADPRNYGMAKSFFMQGSQAGFDMTTQEGLDAFTAFYNSQLAGAGPPGPLSFEDEEEDDLPPPSQPTLTPKQRAEKRKEHKRQRQARKRNRRK